MFKKILIANRGEIAVRVIRACREMGIASVAVYSQADRQALHTRLADQAICIGPAPAKESYLSIDKLLAAAKESGAEAIHPGYGFLSENAAFARAVQAAGLVFIGPSPEAIEAMGDKGRARQQMQASGVPVVPGYQGPDDPDNLAKQAAELGWPLLVKAAAGGGGKGMRVVPAPGEFDEAVGAARREAQHAFGDGRLILERYIPHARHIEFQVLGDAHGHLLHLFERECSVQRRHQKIIEESPSPLLDEALRQRMGAAAVAAARAVNYQNAGTIEFIVDPLTRAFYFLEMNTRLQVEHPVTELVTGLDLVQWQIRIAAGEALSLRQEDLSQRGHAIECRLYAEDPANNFLPASGPLLRFVEPRGPGIRVDAGVSSGSEITIHYDPLIAKLSVWAADRAGAIARMQSALRETVLLGVTNNGQFLQAVLDEADFQAGTVFTTWVEEHFGDWQPPQCSLPFAVLAAAALARQDHQPEKTAGALAGCDPYSPWGASNGLQFEHKGKLYDIRLEGRGAQVQVSIDGQGRTLEVLDTQPGRISLRLLDGPDAGRPLAVDWAESGPDLWLALEGCTYRLEPPKARAAGRARTARLTGGGSEDGAESVRAPMPAQVREVQVAGGDVVEKGQTLLLLEAMKMEIRIKAPTGGRVARVLVSTGQSVDKEQVLAEITPIG